MDADFSRLKHELEHLRAHGYALQESGQEFVKIAESGVANIPIYAKAYTTTRENLSGSPGIQDSLEVFRTSGDLAISDLHSANQNLEAAQKNMYVSCISALSGLTTSNIAMQNLVDYAVKVAPTEKKAVFVELAEAKIERSFTHEDLDGLLGDFRKDLPKRRQGAWDAFYSSSKDAIAQAAHSMRDVLACIIAELGSNKHVEACTWFDRSTKPTLSDRVHLLLYGDDGKIDPRQVAFYASQVSEYVSEDGNLKKIAHGSQELGRESIRLGMQKIEELLYLMLSRRKSKKK